MSVMTPPKWTPAEDAIIIANRAAGIPFAQIATLLPGRSPDACTGRADRLRKAQERETAGRPWEEIEAEIITALKTHSIKNVMHIMRRRYGDRVKMARIAKIYREQVAAGAIKSRAVKPGGGHVDARRIVDQA